jgi:hypothetical protein
MSVLHLLRTVGIACLLLAAAGAATLTAAATGAAPATGLAISGRTTTADGAPIVGATVQAQAATGEIFTATTAVDGVFVVSDVITGVYLLTARAPLHYFHTAIGDINVPPSVTDVQLVGAAYTSIGGHVRDGDGAPLAAITVTAQMSPTGLLYTTRTDAQGAYTLTQLMAGTYRVTPAFAHYRFVPPWRDQDAPPDGSGIDFVGAVEHRVHLPLVHRPPPDLTVRHIEVTQATQTAANNIPLAAGRPTLARVYAVIADAATADGIFLELSATRNGQYIGAVRQGPGIVWADPVRGRYETTFNVRLPAAWLAEEIVLRAQIDPDNAFPEIDEGNNRYTTTLTFRAAPPLRVKWVPIDYTDLPTGVHYPGRWDVQELDFARRVFPVDEIEVSVRAPLAFSGDLRTHEGWSALLVQVSELRFADNAAPDEVYYGLIPIGPADNIPVIYAGLGFVGYRAAIGLVGQPETTAHEIGHNLGLLHAPCGNPAAVDLAYPYIDAQIGEYGVDVVGGRLLSATTYRDLMSYCGPRWISDYHYRKVWQNQQTAARLQPASPAAGLWVRVRFDAEGAAQVLPVYALQAPLTPPVDDGAYTVELLDGEGELLAAQQVALLTAAEDGPALHLLSAILPQPSQPVAAVRVTKAGAAEPRTTLAVRTLATADATARIQPGGAATLTWQPATRPALVRYSADRGQTWTALGVDLAGGAAAVPPDLWDAALLWTVAVGR